jgi:hypothetical protein
MPHVFLRLLFANFLLCLFAIANITVAQNNIKYILDMVHNNPGEPITKTEFNSPKFLATNGYTGKVMNDFRFVHTAITFKKISLDIFPEGSKELQWIKATADSIKRNIAEAKKAGLEIYYFTDIIVLPKKLVELYKNEICDSTGKISFAKPKTIEIHKIMLDEVFETFPDLDGLVIRTGETYLNNVPYHTGNNPILNGPESHIALINLLREEVCVKRNKKIFYRTWGFGGMHDDPDYYLNVTNQIEPHKNLIFSIKHTKGDYQRAYDFNPTLTIGKHQQIIEVQCQREYEGKGAYPNYIANGLIDGFEEYETYKPQTGFKSISQIKNNPNIVGIWTWSRGGGWVGPYITNEFWCKLNALVVSSWAKNKKDTEEEVFDKFMILNGISNKKDFRELCLLSAKGIIRGHSTIKLPFDSNLVWWMRDEFLSGIDSISDNGSRFSSEGFLYSYFKKLSQQNLLSSAIKEKEEAVTIWERIYTLSQKITITNKHDEDYVRVSAHYGLLLHQIIAEGWKIMAYGFEGDQNGQYNYSVLESSIKKYDLYWKEFERLKNENTQCATLYKPYSFVFEAPGYHMKKGIGNTVNKYRKIVTTFTKNSSLSNAILP